MFENVKNCGAGKFISNGEWIHPNRIIDSNEIIFVTKGEVYINENGTEYHINPDEILILQPNLRHFGYKVSTNTEFFWLHWYGGPNIDSNIKHRKIENPYNISLYFRQLLDARVLQKSSEGMDYLNRLILIELYSNSKPPVVNRTAEKIAAWIMANCHTAITEMQIASQFGYNSDYLNRLFKSSFSKTIKQYINDKRIEYIKALMLRGELPLKEIANQSGFAEYKYFLKFFKYHEKITPTEFYKQYTKMHINSR
jgi:AraC-like DNA-binding protein